MVRISWNDMDSERRCGAPDVLSCWQYKCKRFLGGQNRAAAYRVTAHGRECVPRTGTEGRLNASVTLSAKEAMAAPSGHRTLHEYGGEGRGEKKKKLFSLLAAAARAHVRRGVVAGGRAVGAGCRSCMCLGRGGARRFLNLHGHVPGVVT
jgi:hypothetical protein